MNKSAHHGSVREGGYPPNNGQKARRLRRGAPRNALQDLYLILLIFCGDIQEIDPGLAGVLRENLNQWAKMYALMGGNWGYGQRKAYQPKTMAETAVEEEREHATIVPPPRTETSGPLARSKRQHVRDY